jgi:DUF1009 family protein
MPPNGKLGVIAGAGSLPRQIIAEAIAQGRSVFVVAFTGHCDPATVENMPHRWFRLGQAGAVLKELRRQSVHDIVMAGAIRRPSLAELRPDFYTIRFYARLGVKGLGDDGLLRAIAHLLEGEGFRVIGAKDIVGDLIIQKGVLGSMRPSDIHLADIAHGFSVIATLGGIDIGQAVVVQQGMVLGVEAAEGTAQLIARCAGLARGGSRPVLVKAAKPGQDTRLDLPTIGAATIEQLSAADFAGIAIEAGRTIVLDTAAVVASADLKNLFIAAYEPHE